MKIDLHVHSKACSDGRLSLPEIFEEARTRGVGMISVTDHDSIECQESAEALASRVGLLYLYGVELNITFSHPDYKGGKAVSLDVLGYGYDIHDGPLSEKVLRLREYRVTRAGMILEKVNEELRKEDIPPLTEDDLDAIEASVDGAFGRPHIADYMVKKGLVPTRQEAFDRYLVSCNVPKMPLSLEEASALIRGAGGKLVLAHPANARGTSLNALTKDLREQHRIIREAMLPFLDGVECWHPGHTTEAVMAYLALARDLKWLVTGGSDCHQQPVVIGSMDVPSYVALQFGMVL